MLIDNDLHAAKCASTFHGACKPFFSMSGASLGPLLPAGWACSERGEIKNGEPQCKEEEEGADEYQYQNASFKHSQSLKEGDVWRMKVVEGEYASV